MTAACISALAWSEQDEPQIFKLLQKHVVRHIELIPHRLHGSPLQTKSILADLNIQATAFQALLFGTQDLHLFQTERQREQLFAHLAGLCDQAAILGVKSLVFGSPKNRFIDLSVLSMAAAQDIAAEFFLKLAEVAKAAQTHICLEPNPTHYGANFLTTTLETADFVKRLNHPAVRLNLDLGAVALNTESLARLWPQIRNWIGHIHWSLPDLKPVYSGPTDDLKTVVQLLKGEAADFRSDGVISIEMTPAKDPSISTLAHAERALTLLKRLQENGPDGI